MTETKKTKRMMYEELLALNLTDEQKAFIKHELELLDKKNSGEHKPTANQLENQKLAKVVAEGMEPNRQYTATEVMKEFNIPSTSRATSVLKVAVDNGDVKKETVKGKSLYSLA